MSRLRHPLRIVIASGVIPQSPSPRCSATTSPVAGSMTRVLVRVAYGSFPECWYRERTTRTRPSGSQLARSSLPSDTLLPPTTTSQVGTAVPSRSERYAGPAGGVISRVGRVDSRSGSGPDSTPHPDAANTSASAVGTTLPTRVPRSSMPLQGSGGRRR